MEQGFKQEHLQVVCISDNMKYFVFEGPNFAHKEKKEKKGKKGERRASKKDGGLLTGLF